jgi:trans-aconitate methyltransferase
MAGHAFSASAPLTPDGASMALMFDKLGMEYERAFAGRKQAQVDAVARLVSGLSPGARVLDVGCGTGRPTTEQLCAAGMKVTGTDVSDVMLGHARQHVPQARFVKADLFIDNPALGTYDAVLSLFCLIDLAESRFVEGFEKLLQYTAPGGTVLVAVPEYRDDSDVQFLDISYKPRLCRREDVAEWAVRAGLEVERMDVVSDPGPLGRPEPGESVFLWGRAPARG